jgi:signal transduction histidine kinase
MEPPAQKVGSNVAESGDLGHQSAVGSGSGPVVENEGDRTAVSAPHLEAESPNGPADLASRVKDDFLAAVSHEIRTPLSAVLGWVRMLGSAPLSPERTKYALGVIERNATTIAHLVDDLLDTSRILNGAIRLASLSVDLVAVVREAVDTVQPLAAVKNVTLTVDAAADSLTVTGDSERLQQVIWNLLSNAIKFTPEGGRVGILVDSVNDRAEIKVVDTGKGIGPDFLPHVFERFSQAGGATTPRHTGLGLGLGIVRRLVELHGGTVQAESSGVGQGATFTVRLPLFAALPAV